MDVIGDPAEWDGGRPPRRRLEGWHGDFVYALTDGLIALGTAVVVAVLGVMVLRYAWASHLHGGAADYFSLGVWLTGASLGVPVHMSASTTFGPGHSLDEHLQLRAIVWLLTAIVLTLIYLLARRRERVQPSTGSARAAVRALLTALVVTAVLLVLSLVTKRPGVFGYPFFGSNAGLKSAASMGLEPGFVFAGPLLLSAIAALAGRAGGWRTSDGAVAAGRARATGELSRWRPVLRVAWRQILVTGGLAGVALLIYLAVYGIQHGGARHTAVIVTGLVLLLPNLAVYGTLGGFGTTFYGTLKTTSLGEGITPVGGTYSVGIFGSHRVWIVWLLLAAAVAGTVVPALLARLDSIDLPITGAWRAAVTGLAVGVAEVLLGEISAASSTSGVVTFSAAGGSFYETVSAGPSLLAAAGLSALWFALGYLAAAVAVRPRLRAPDLS